MKLGAELRPDAVAELVRVLRDQVSHHAEHIADLEARLSAANQRIAEQQQLLAKLLETNAAGSSPVAALPARSPEPAPPGLQPEPARREIRPAPPRAPAAPAPPVDRVSPPAARPRPVQTVVRIPAAAKGSPQISAIAGTVLQAGETPRQPEFECSSAVPVAVAHKPTIGVVRATATESAVPGATERTLTLSREGLESGHRRLSGRRWFLFGRRRN